MKMNGIFQRQMCLSEKSPQCPVITVDQILAGMRNPKLNIEPMLTTFLKESCTNAQYADNFIKPYIVLMNEFYKKESPYFNTIFESFKKLIMRTGDQKAVKHYIAESLLPDKYINEVIELAESNIVLDRIVNNDAKIKSRFKLNETINAISNGEDEYAIAESICSLINTYNMPIHKRLTIALEETLYLYTRLDKTPNTNKLLESMLDYFLANESYLLDKDINKLKSTIKENVFLAAEDREAIEYFLNSDDITAADRLRILYNNIVCTVYKQALDEISRCTSTREVSIIINRTISKIYCAYGLTGESTLDESLNTFKALFALQLTLGINTDKIINEIKKSLDSISITMNPKDDDEAKLRCEELTRNMASILNKFDTGNCCIEASKILDSAILDKKLPDTTINKVVPDVSDIEDIYTKDFDRCSIREEVVDSNDVKEAINHYKAQEHKDSNTLVRMVKSWYVPSAKSIIDETPHILGFIRRFGVVVPPFLIPNIGPVIALVNFIVDYFINQDINRKEADKMLKFFKKERENVDKQLSKAKGDDKERLEKYAKELDKAILNIGQYKDDLYSDEALDKMQEEELMESTCMNLPKSTSVEFFAINHENICNNINSTINMVGYRFDMYNIIYEYYHINGDTIQEYFTDIKTIDQLSRFINQDGSMTIPLIIAESGSYETEELINRICNEISHSENIDMSHCLISAEWCGEKKLVGSLFLIVLKVFDKLDLDFIPEIDKDKIALESDLNMCANIQVVSEMVENVNNNQNIMQEVCDNFDQIVMDEAVEDISRLISISNLDTFKYEHKLNEAYNNIDVSTEPIQSIRIYNAIQCFNNPQKNDSLELESSIIDTLSVVVEASKRKDKSSGGIMDVIKNKSKEIKNNKNAVEKEIHSTMGNVANKTKDGKVALTTNLGLAIEAMKKTAQNLGTKEKELSTSLDASASYFKRSLEKALTSDRREAIIKGSIIPSFSKCIKTAAAAGLAFAVNPVIGIIGCVGALACSKALTEKERKLLLDEIDIELQVVNREIDNIGSDTSSAKYRQLITYKKRLQRESQRIRYRIKVYSKEQLPPSSEC